MVVEPTFASSLPTFSELTYLLLPQISEAAHHFTLPIYGRITLFGTERPAGTLCWKLLASFKY